MDMNKKILLISNMYPSKKYPHYGIFVEESAKVLEKNGYDVDVLYLEKHENSFVKFLFYTKFYVLTFLKIVFSSYSIVYAHYASHTSIPVLLGLCFNKKIKLVVNVHGNDIVPEDRHDEKYIRLVRKMLNKANVVICPSSYFRQIIINKYEIPIEKTYVYPSGGVDTNFFVTMPTEEAKQMLHISSDYRYIGYVSRIEKDKGWDLFLDMASKLIKLKDNIKFIVVGDGSESCDYNRKVKELGLEKEILKYTFLPRNDLKLIYNALDVFVFPTYRKSESLGLVGLEAMSCESIVILPDMYGPTSYEENMENSIVFESGNADDLLEKTLYALDIKREDMQKNARKTAEQFSSSNTGKILVSIFSSLMDF